MQTAALITKALNMKSVKINYEYSESMLGSYFKENPMPKMEWWNADPKTLNNEFDLLDVEFVDARHFKKEECELYPETYEECTFRCIRGI